MGLLFFGDKMMLRHVGFRTGDHVQDRFARSVPMHSYHSTADYQDLGEPARGQEGQRLADHRATCNADMPARDVAACCRVTPRGKEVLHAAMRQLHLSARGYHRVLKVGRTIADLEGADLIDTSDIAEALQYRKREGD